MTTRALAASLVLEHYEQQVDTDALTVDQTEALLQLIERETDRLHFLLVRATEAWRLDADQFDTTSKGIGV